MHSNLFGEHFYWGASISAAQTESAALIDGKGLSIWDEFCEPKKNFFLSKHRIKNKHHIQESSDFYFHYEADILRLKQLGFKHFRFSIAWSRIYPDGETLNPSGIDFYKKVIDTCLKNNIEPWVTLYHWDLPATLEKKGGWTNPEIINWFELFATTCINSFKEIKHWMILNEPSVFVGAGYFFGIHAPGKKGFENFIKAMHHANLCIHHIFKVIKNINPDLKVGSTFSFTHIEGLNQDIKHQKAAEIADTLINRLFFEPILGLGYPTEQLKIFNKKYFNLIKKEEESLKTPLDFIGIQNYTREIFKYNPFNPFLKIKQIEAHKRTSELTAMNWEIHPPSIYEVLKKINNYQSNIPIIVTENGIALNDQINDNSIQDSQRIAFYQSHLEQVLKAKNEGIDIQGYFAWSLLDNFEWAEGYYPRFGLIHVDFETKHRTIKESGHWFREFLGET